MRYAALAVRGAALFLLLLPAACSKQQLAKVVQTMCQSWDHCTVYDENGNAARDWPPPRSQIEP